MPKIAFLGLGNIANAIISGLISNSHRIIAFDPIEECRERARDLGVSITVDNTEAVSQADIVILCVKPDVVLDLLDEISTVSLGKLFISVRHFSIRFSIRFYCLLFRHTSIHDIVPHF